jgi:hypothetical protein
LGEYWDEDEDDSEKEREGSDDEDLFMKTPKREVSPQQCGTRRFVWRKKG